jgi:hypothetical protein
MAPPRGCEASSPAVADSSTGVAGSRCHASAWNAVDSLRVGNKERGFFRTAGLVLGIGGVWAYLTRGIGGD